MSAPVRITERRVGGVVLLQLEGHLVFGDGDRVLRERVTSLAGAGERSFLLDLQRVDYIDSGGVGALVEVYMHLMRRGGRMKLLRPSACAARVLRITHLSSVFEIFDDEEQAVRSMGAHVGNVARSG